MTEANRRRQQRFDLEFPVQVRVRQADKPQVQTLTRDISAGGVFFTMQEPCEPGSLLECVVTLPPEQCQGKTVQIVCSGRVIRVERPANGSKVGVAATIERYEFIRAQ